MRTFFTNLSDLLVSYSGLILLMPDMFPQPERQVFNVDMVIEMQKWEESNATSEMNGFFISNFLDIENWESNK